MAPLAKPSELVGTVGTVGTVEQWKWYTLQDLIPKQNHQGQTGYQEQQVVTLLMCTKTNKVTVGAIPCLKENKTQDQKGN